MKIDFGYPQILFCENLPSFDKEINLSTIYFEKSIGNFINFSQNLEKTQIINYKLKFYENNLQTEAKILDIKLSEKLMNPIIKIYQNYAFICDYHVNFLYILILQLENNLCIFLFKILCFLGRLHKIEYKPVLDFHFTDTIIKIQVFY